MAEFEQVSTSGGPDPQVMGALNGVQGVLVKQKVDLLEAAATTAGCSCCEQANTYTMYDKMSGNPMYIVKEDSNVFWRCCCKPTHPAQLKFFATNDGKQMGQQVFEAEKPCKCPCASIALLGCCRDEIILRGGAGEEGPVVGAARMPFMGGCFKPTFDILDGQENTKGKIVGPCCFIGDFCDTAFVYEDEKTGAQSPIEKQGLEGMSDAIKELATDADTFMISFGGEMSPENKATLLAATLLIDYTFYEGDGAFKCDPIEKSCSITCCAMYCCGYTQPCKCKCGGGEEGPGPE